jgi:hypothetical protein
VDDIEFSLRKNLRRTDDLLDDDVPFKREIRAGFGEEDRVQI